MRQDTNYAYAVARIKVLENKLLSSSDIDALINTDPGALIASLSAFGYPSPEHTADEQTEDSGRDALASYTEILSGFFSEIVRSVMTFSPEPEVLRCFLIPTDFNNLKICVKNISRNPQAAEADVPELSRNGNVDPELMWNAFISNDFKKLDPVMARAAEDACAEMSKTGNARNSDILIDKACFSAMNEAVSKGCFYTRRVLGRYLSTYADWKNMLASMRIAASGAGNEMLDKAYLTGSIPKDHFKKVISGEISPFSGTRYEKFISSVLGSKQYQGQDIGDISFMEWLSEAFISAELMKNKNEPYRINAILAYISARKREIAAVRLIIVGKRTDLSADAIRELVDNNNFMPDFLQ